MSVKNAKKTLSLPAETSLTFKKLCVLKSRNILRERTITGMSEKDLAAELYFHACIAKAAKPLAEKKIPFFVWLFEHADPIDLESGGDTPFRKVIFRFFWFLPEIH